MNQDGKGGAASNDPFALARRAWEHEEQEEERQDRERREKDRARRLEALQKVHDLVCERLKNPFGEVDLGAPLLQVDGTFEHRDMVVYPAHNIAFVLKDDGLCVFRTKKGRKKGARYDMPDDRAVRQVVGITSLHDLPEYKPDDVYSVVSDTW